MRLQEIRDKLLVIKEMDNKDRKKHLIMTLIYDIDRAELRIADEFEAATSIEEPPVEEP